VNLTGAFLCMQQVLAAMVEAKAGPDRERGLDLGAQAFQNVAAYTASEARADRA